MVRDLENRFPELNTPIIWLDFWDYTQGLFLKGQPIEWLNLSEFDGYYRQALDLLKPTVAPIDLERIIKAYFAQNPGIRNSMTQRPRTGFPLKTLLSDAGLRALVSRLCSGTADARKSRPLALTICSPQKLLTSAYEFAHDEPMKNISPDDCERAAVYLTDFLGALGLQQGVFVLLVDKDQEAAHPDYKHALKPLSNLCNHMRWHLALSTKADITDPMSAEIAFTPRGLDGVWAEWGSEKEDKPKAIYAQIPAEADPESVLGELRRLSLS